MKRNLSQALTGIAGKLVLLAVLAGGAGSGIAAAETMYWEEVAVLPPAQGETVQQGVAGAFAGVHGDVLLIGGGANFPKEPPWDGGPKVWWDSIFVLERTLTEGAVVYAWAEVGEKLPAPTAYGVSIGIGDGVVCIGGCDAADCRTDVNLLQWDGSRRAVVIRKFPPLPRPLAFMAGARVGDWIFVAGGQETMDKGVSTRNFFGLDLSQRAAGDERFRWVELPPWDGPERILPVASGHAGTFFLFSGRRVDGSGGTEILSDAHAFDPATRQWEKLGDVRVGNEDPRCIMAASSCEDPSGKRVLVFGGADGVIMRMLEHNSRKARSENRLEAEAFGRFNLALLANHPGFGRDVLAYDPATGAWSKLADFPDACPVTTPAVRWGEAIFLPSGETRPGVRSGRIWKGFIVKPVGGGDP